MRRIFNDPQNSETVARWKTLFRLGRRFNWQPAFMKGSACVLPTPKLMLACPWLKHPPIDADHASRKDPAGPFSSVVFALDLPHERPN
jgi:hypothetical protein